MSKNENFILDYLKQPDVFADLFNGYFFHGEQIIQPAMLQPIDSKYCLAVTEASPKPHSETLQFIKRERDAVYSAQIDSQPIHLVICGLEHQSKIDYSMPLRSATYDILEYLRQAKNISVQHEQNKDLNSVTYLSKFSENDRLVPTLTLIFYTGKDIWNTAMNLNQLFQDIPYKDILIPYMLSAPLNVVSAYHITHHEWYKGRIRKIFDILPYTDDSEQLREYLSTNHDIYSNLDEATSRILGFMMDVDLFTASNQNKTGGTTNMCKAIEDIRNMGFEQGLESIIFTMLKKGKSSEEISSLTDIPVEKINLIKLKVME
jgi:hypothetical protein